MPKDATETISSGTTSSKRAGRRKEKGKGKATEYFRGKAEEDGGKYGGRGKGKKVSKEEGKTKGAKGQYEELPVGHPNHPHRACENTMLPPVQKPSQAGNQIEIQHLKKKTLVDQDMAAALQAASEIYVNRSEARG